MPRPVSEQKSTKRRSHQKDRLPLHFIPMPDTKTTFLHLTEELISLVIVYLPRKHPLLLTCKTTSRIAASLIYSQTRNAPHLGRKDVLDGLEIARSTRSKPFGPDWKISALQQMRVVRLDMDARDIYLEEDLHSNNTLVKMFDKMKSNGTVLFPRLDGMIVEGDPVQIPRYGETSTQSEVVGLASISAPRHFCWGGSLPTQPEFDAVRVFPMTFAKTSNETMWTPTTIIHHNLGEGRVPMVLHGTLNRVEFYSHFVHYDGSVSSAINYLVACRRFSHPELDPDHDVSALAREERERRDQTRWEFCCVGCRCESQSAYDLTEAVKEGVELAIPAMKGRMEFSDRHAAPCQGCGASMGSRF